MKSFGTISARIRGGRYYISACDFWEQGPFEMGCRIASYTVARVQAVNSPTPARDQYHDRMLYWNLKWLSRRRDRGVLTIIIDSMDKAKNAMAPVGVSKAESIRPLSQAEAGADWCDCTRVVHGFLLVP